MKKILSLLLCFCVLFSTACSMIDAPSTKKMIKYYSDDSNYEEVTGIVKEKRDSEYIIVMITTEYHTYYSDTESHYIRFTLWSHSALTEHINVGDEITLISSSMRFYASHTLPIIALKKDGEVLLSFEEGKAGYLAWIQEKFD